MTMPRPITEARKILVRVPNWVGDAIMSLPALFLLEKQKLQF